MESVAKTALQLNLHRICNVRCKFMQETDVRFKQKKKNSSNSEKSRTDYVRITVQRSESPDWLNCCKWRTDRPIRRRSLVYVMHSFFTRGSVTKRFFFSTIPQPISAVFYLIIAIIIERCKIKHSGMLGRLIKRNPNRYCFILNDAFDTRQNINIYNFDNNVRK